MHFEVCSSVYLSSFMINLYFLLAEEEEISRMIYWRRFCSIFKNYIIYRNYTGHDAGWQCQCHFKYGIRQHLMGSVNFLAYFKWFFMIWNFEKSSNTNRAWWMPSTASEIPGIMTSIGVKEKWKPPNMLTTTTKWLVWYGVCRDLRQEIENW